MMLEFFKFEGTGNDFIMLDGRYTQFNLSQEQIEELCNRRFGIGADGLIILAPEPGYDFRMVYYNADGRPSTMCGNGGRCITAFAAYLGIIKDKASFTAADGPHEGLVNMQTGRSWDISLKMIDVDGYEKIGADYYINTGSPHYVQFVANVDAVDVYNQGKAIRNSPRFAAQGTNVNFIHPTNGHIAVRTYERGVEDETYSCGTGVTAAAIASYLHGTQSPNNQYPIEVKGGSLRVQFDIDDEKFTNVWLSGPAKFVYKGVIEV